MSDVTPEELVKEAIKPGKFSIVNALKESSHPTDTVTIFLDEQTAYLASGVKAKIAAIVDEASDERKVLKKELDELVTTLKTSAVTFTLEGISEGKREAMLARSIEKFPIQIKRDLNPLTGEFIEADMPSAERDGHFTDALWQSHITKIVGASGDEQTVITNNDVAVMRTDLPIAAVGTITEAIEKLRVATAMFMIETNEDFLAKS
tara:strand:+ start:2851 stop:3468 length:618 start_codon:yes stop_codon:yes gene_type:complete